MITVNIGTHAFPETQDATFVEQKDGLIPKSYTLQNRKRIAIDKFLLSSVLSSIVLSFSVLNTIIFVKYSLILVHPVFGIFLFIASLFLLITTLLAGNDAKNNQYF